MAAARSALGFVVTTSILATFGCQDHGTPTSLTQSQAQALRTCVDRWNQANMLGWGPALVDVSVRRLDAARLAQVGLRDPRKPRCVVSLAVEFRRDPRKGCSGLPTDPGSPDFCVDRSATYNCAINRFGAYRCPRNGDTLRTPLRRKNARTDENGVLSLDSPLEGSRPKPPLAWHRRYPHFDGWIEPWTPSGKLRPGLHFGDRDHGPCFGWFEKTRTRPVLGCLASNLGRVDPCFPSKRNWRPGDLAACATSPGATTFVRWTITRRPANASDPPLLVPWHKIGDISLGASKARVQAEYGSINHPYRDIAQGFYRLHGSKVWVTFDRGRVQAIGFTSPYYRTKRGFGVGSTIPLGPCHGSARGQCEHRWHGFVFNEWWKEKPCGCWTKVGLGPRSLPATAKNYLRPWFIIYVTRGRVSEFYFDLKFVD